MIRNHIMKSDLIKRINLNDSKVNSLLMYLRIFYLLILRKYVKENNIDFSVYEDIDTFIKQILLLITNNEKNIIPKEIENFLEKRKIDFDSFSLEIYTKCFNCKKISSIEFEKISINRVLDFVEQDLFFCLSCFTITENKIIQRFSKVGQKTVEKEDGILYFGNSVLSSLFETIEKFELEKKYSNIIIEFCNEIINYVYKDDEKAHRYFLKLVEELAEEYVLHKLIFLHPNYRYSYPEHFTFI